MRRWPALVMALALICTGCRFSKVDPAATVTVSGRALDAAGHPLAGVKVQLFKEADLGQMLFGAVVTLGSLGAVCLLPQAPAICHKAHTATTDGAGRYSFRLSGADTQGTLGTEATLDVVVADPAAGPDGPSTTVGFHVRSSAVRLPDARLWDARARVSERGGAYHLAWSPLPAAAGSAAEYSAQLFDAGNQVPMWSQPAGAGHGAIDARLLEDHTGTVAVAAHTGLGGTADAHASYLSARLPVRPTAGAPPSRGRACLAVVGKGGSARAGARQQTCAATDGDFGTPARLVDTGGAGGTVVTGVVVDLGRVRPVRLVVARGLAGQIWVELSRDGRHYRRLGAPVQATPDAAVTVAGTGAATARYVRVRSASGLDESLLTEVSVW